MSTIATAAQYANWAETQGLDPAPGGLAGALATATREVRDFCRREFLPSPEAPETTETRQVIGDGTTVLFIPDCLTLVSVSCNGAPVSDYRREPPGATPITRLVRRSYRWPDGGAVTLTGRFGYAEQADLPAVVVEACCMLAATRLLSAQEWGVGERGVKRQRVLNVDIEYETQPGGGLAGKREAALALLKPYRRMF